LFQTRTTAILLVTTFLHAVAFFAGSYYLPLYFQVLGASATRAGVEMLPFSLGSAAFSIVGGVVVSRTGVYRPVMWVSFAIFALGMGLMIMLDAYSTTVEKVWYPLVAAIGLGSLFQTPLIGLQAAMPIKDMATSTSTFGFLRILGATVGISIGQAIYSSTLQKKIVRIANVGLNTSPAALSQSVHLLHLIPDPATRAAVIQAYSQSISTIWLVMTPILGASLFMVLFLKQYTLVSTIVHAEDRVKEATADIEKGSVNEETGEGDVKESDTTTTGSESKALQKE
jgi:hypothetical protein